MYFIKLFVYINLLCHVRLQGNALKDYETKLLSLDHCKLPESKYDKNNIIAHSTSSKRVDRKNFTLHSNYTVSKKVGPIHFNFKAYQLQRSSVRDLEYKREDLSCKDQAILEIIEIAKLKFDGNCFLLPGTYISENINLDSLSKILTRGVVTAGKYAYDIELSTRYGIISCLGIAIELK